MDNIFTDEAVADLHTIQDLLRWTMSRFNAADLFYGHGTDNSWDEALQLVLPTLYLPIDFPPSLLNSRLTNSERFSVIKRVIERINDRTPTAYLTNKAWFCGLEFFVDERVLIPRSPIGELIESQFQPWLIEEPKRIMDLCTGSGCIAIACAHAFPDAEIDAIDISAEALEVAEQNIQTHGVEQQITPIKSDLFAEVKGEKYDLIVSNPPYVDAEDMNNLPKEFQHEPEIGLTAGSDGLELVKNILINAPQHLTENGMLICEVGNSMLHMIEQYPNVPLTWIEFENGGHGVFMLTRAQIVEYMDDFK